MPSCQIFTEEEIASLRKGGKILRACLDHVASLVEPGVTTRALDEAAETFICSHNGAKPGFKGYHGFPATLCTSVNEQCVHGLPGDRVLHEGDIISVDCGVIFKGLYTDACITVPVGSVSAEAQSLLTITKRCLEKVVDLTKEGVRVGDISFLIQATAEKEGFHPVRALTGHGLGTTLHQFPDIPNIGTAHTGAKLPSNTIIAVEPIISAGSDAVREADDGWTLSTKDGALCAHFEHTLLIHHDYCEILA